MAGFIQNYVGGIVQNAAVGAATYAITTGGRVVGDAVISAGDLIEGAGRGVGNSVEGYIDRYGNWIRSYGDSAIAATAADAPAYARTRTAVKPPKQKAPPGGAQKALPAPNKPGTKALPAPEPKKARPGLKKSLSDSAPTAATATTGAKGLPPVSGVKKVGGGAQLSKGQLAKARGIKAADLKGAGGKAAGAVGGAAGAVGGRAAGAVGGGVGALGGGVARAVPGVGGKKSPAQSGGKKPASSGGSEAGSTAGSTASTAATKKTGAAVNGGVPSARTPLPPAGGAEKKSAQYPKPFSAKRPDGKVVVSKESRPGAVKSAAPKGGVGAGAGKQEGKKEYDFLTADKKQGGGKGKDGKGGFDFMTLMAEDPKKKGPGSVAGSVKTNGTAKKTGAVGGGGKQETSGKYEFF